MIRPATHNDATEIARLATELGYPTAAAVMADRLAALLDDPRHHVAVAAGPGGRLLGWAHVEHRQSLEGGQRAELMGLIVDSTARQRGLGRGLVETIQAWVTARGLKALTVRSNAARIESHPFYAALGFEHEKTQHVYVKRSSHS